MKKFTLLAISAAFVFSINAAHAGTSEARSAVTPSKLFYLKGEAPTGSRIPSIDATSTIPFNKRFDALTAEQQNLVKTKFDDLRNNDTPPFPTSGLRAVYKPLINANQVFGDNSDLNVTAKVNSSGFVSGVTVHNSGNPRLVNYIEQRLQQVKFEPAKCNGIACDMDFPIEISFN
ncbi:MAG: hypothetical protein JKX81_03995 [Arenicella sp.]|nr:hypothetical protein [Arenicella sp.]